MAVAAQVRSLGLDFHIARTFTAGALQVRFNIGERLKQVLDLEPSTLIEYKHHQIAMQDMSTFR